MGGPGSGARWVRTGEPPAAEVLDRLPHVIAKKVFAMRRLLGLSQEELAHKAHVSQGAISRLESGQCEGTPLRTIAAVFLALAVELQPMAASCTDEVREFLQVVTGLFPMALEDKEFTALKDPGLAALMRAYGLLEGRDRLVFLRVVTPLFELLTGRLREE